MNLEERVGAFGELGQVLRNLFEVDKNVEAFSENIKESALRFKNLVDEAYRYNGWFTTDMVTHMVRSIGNSLEEEKLQQWIKPYRGNLIDHNSPKSIAVIMAGNIPLVGFNDFLYVLISGNNLLARLSSDDNKLMPALFDLLVQINQGFEGRVKFIEGKLEKFDAVIATGSNNTSRYFEYYFGKYPNIIRKNRNGIAVLNGSESVDEFNGLSDDIFLYYGLGCRNVSKIFVPENYDFTSFLDVASERKKIAENHKYFNNYEYNKAIYLVNSTHHYDAGNLILTENENTASPVSVVYFEFYKNLDSVKAHLDLISDQVQCVVSNCKVVNNEVEFGHSQEPELWDYADGIDTMEFLLSLD